MNKNTLIFGCIELFFNHPCRHHERHRTVNSGTRATCNTAFFGAPPSSPRLAPRTNLESMWDGRRLTAVNVDYITSPGGSDVVNRQVIELRALRARVVKLADACKSSVAGISEQLNRVRVEGTLQGETLSSFQEELRRISEDLAEVSTPKQRVLKPHSCLSALTDIQKQLDSLRNDVTCASPLMCAGEVEEDDAHGNSEDELVPEEYEISGKESTETEVGRNCSRKRSMPASVPKFQPRAIVAKPLPPTLPPRIISANFLPDVDECSSSDETCSAAPLSAGAEAAKLKSRFSELRDIARSLANPESIGDQAKLRQFHSGILELMDSAAASPRPFAGDRSSIYSRRKKLEARFLAAMAFLSRDGERDVEDAKAEFSEGPTPPPVMQQEKQMYEPRNDEDDDDTPSSECDDSVSVVSDDTEFLDNYSEESITEIDEDGIGLRDFYSESESEVQNRTHRVSQSNILSRQGNEKMFAAETTTDDPPDSLEHEPRKQLSSRISGLRDIANSFDLPKSDENRKSSLSQLHVGVMGLLDSAISAAPGTSGSLRIQRIKERLEKKYHSAMSSIDSMDGDNFELTSLE